MKQMLTLPPWDPSFPALPCSSFGVFKYRMGSRGAKDKRHRLGQGDGVPTPTLPGIFKKKTVLQGVRKTKRGERQV